MITILVSILVHKTTSVGTTKFLTKTIAHYEPVQPGRQGQFQENLQVPNLRSCSAFRTAAVEDASTAAATSGSVFRVWHAEIWFVWHEQWLMYWPLKPIIGNMFPKWLMYEKWLMYNCRSLICHISQIKVCSYIHSGNRGANAHVPAWHCLTLWGATPMHHHILVAWGLIPDEGA